MKIATASSEKGFTLIELLIAITLVATIILIVTGAVRLGYRSVASGEKKMDNLERFRASFAIVDAQIQSGVPLMFDDQGTKRPYFEGTREYMRVATNYSIWGGRKGYVIVEYRTVVDENGKVTLTALENPVGTALKRQTALFRGLDQIYFEYFSQDSPEEEGQWMDQWSDDTKPPQKVRIWLISGRREISLIIPMRAEGSAGQASLAPSITERGRAERLLASKFLEGRGVCV
jgi:prepilin-type N-terminal cleavage/methylation domain-containing protein